MQDCSVSVVGPCTLIIQMTDAMHVLEMWPTLRGSFMHGLAAARLCAFRLTPGSLCFLRMMNFLSRHLSQLWSGVVICSPRAPSRGIATDGCCGTARAMLLKADILLLDEPTNHLDSTNVAWLENYLCSLAHVTSLIVSHDSGFLDTVCTDIIDYNKQKLTVYKACALPY